MIATLALALCAQATANKMLDAFAAAETAHPRQSVEITTVSTLSGKESHITYVMSFIRPSLLRLEIKQPSSDRIFSIEGSRFTAYDRDLNQFVTRTVWPQGTLVEKLGQVIGNVDESYRILLDAS